MKSTQKTPFVCARSTPKLRNVSAKRKGNGKHLMIDVINQHGGMIGLASLVIALLALVYTWYRAGWLPDVKERLQNPAQHGKIIEEKSSPWGDAYFEMLDQLTGWANTFYRGSAFSPNALGRCFMLAMVYPVLAALLAWVLANTHSPGGLQLFHDTPTLLGRLWRAMALIAGTVALLLYFANIDRISDRINTLLGYLWPALTKADGFLSKASAFVIVGFVVVVGCVVVVGFVVVVGGVITGNTELTALYAFFFLLLPICNAAADFASVGATRKFLAHVGRAPVCSGSCCYW